MNSNDFENELKSQSFRKVPEHWRKQILSSARTRPESDATAPSWRRTLRELFWPAPAAWGMLAAAWVVVICLRFAASDTPSPSTAAPETYAKLRIAIEQKRELYAELAGTTSHPPVTPPKPRSQRKSSFRSA